jgi:hypothetical protein
MATPVFLAGSITLRGRGSDARPKAPTPDEQTEKSFLVLFFKEEPLLSAS